MEQDSGKGGLLASLLGVDTQTSKKQIPLVRNAQAEVVPDDGYGHLSDAKLIRRLQNPPSELRYGD